MFLKTRDFANYSIYVPVVLVVIKILGKLLFAMDVMFENAVLVYRSSFEYVSKT